MTNLYDRFMFKGLVFVLASDDGPGRAFEPWVSLLTAFGASKVWPLTEAEVVLEDGKKLVVIAPVSYKGRGAVLAPKPPTPNPCTLSTDTTLALYKEASFTSTTKGASLLARSNIVNEFWAYESIAAGHLLAPELFPVGVDWKPLEVDQVDPDCDFFIIVGVQQRS